MRKPIQVLRLLWRSLCLYQYILTSGDIGYEMKRAFSEYFPTMMGAPVKNLAELVVFNNAHEKLAFAEGRVPYSNQ